MAISLKRRLGFSYLVMMIFLSFAAVEGRDLVARSYEEVVKMGKVEIGRRPAPHEFVGGFSDIKRSIPSCPDPLHNR